MPNQPEDLCGARWTLSDKGWLQLGTGLFVIVVALAMPLLMVFIGFPFPDIKAATVFLWVMTVFAAFACGVTVWKVVHTPTSVEFRPWGLELGILGVRRVRVDRSEVLAVECRPARLGQPEQHLVRFRRGHIDLSPAYFDRYAELVACCQELVREAGNS